MMDENRFELQQVTDMEWIVRDHHFDLHDSRCLIACIWRVEEDEFEVNWLRDEALSTRYTSPQEVLNDLLAKTSRHTKPVPIPHFPPAS